VAVEVIRQHVVVDGSRDVMCVAHGRLLPG
jgi:hypothetical protein